MCIFFEVPIKHDVLRFSLSVVSIRELLQIVIELFEGTWALHMLPSFHIYRWNRLFVSSLLVSLVSHFRLFGWERVSKPLYAP